MFRNRLPTDLLTRQGFAYTNNSTFLSERFLLRSPIPVRRPERAIHNVQRVNHFLLLTAVGRCREGRSLLSD